MSGMNEVWGFDWNGIDSMDNDGPAAGHRYTFQVTSAKRDVNKKGGHYVNVGCKVVRSDIDGAEGRVHWEYCSLDKNRIGFTKAFFENIGAGHVLTPGKGPQDAVGVIFEADLRETPNANDAGNPYKNLRNIVAVSLNEDDEEEPETDDEDDEEEEEQSSPATRPAPTKAKVSKRR